MPLLYHELHRLPCATWRAGALTAADPRKAHVVELRFFGSLSVEAAAAAAS